MSYSDVCVPIEMGLCMARYLKMKMLFQIWLTLDDLVIKSRTGLVWFMNETFRAFVWAVLGIAQHNFLIIYWYWCQIDIRAVFSWLV